MAKTKTNTIAKKNANPAGSPAAGAPAQKKSSKACLTCGIIALILLVVLVIGIIGLKIAGNFIPPAVWYGLFQKLGLEKLGPLSKINLEGSLTGNDPGSIVNPDGSVSQPISAKNGGSISVTTKSGLTATLHVPPGSLKKDTTITVSPNKKDPVEDIDPAPEDPGVTIDPPGTAFDPPATIVFSYNPPTSPVFTPYSGSGLPEESNEDDFPNLPDLSKPSPGTGADTLPPDPPNSAGSIPSIPGYTQAPPGSGSPDGTNDSSRQFPDNTTIVFVSWGGTVTSIPTSRSDDGSTVQGEVDESGSTTPQNPDTEGAEALVDAARAASGGACTGQYIDALARMVAVAGNEGNDTAVARYESEIRRCNDESLEHLRRLCNNNPIQLRRKDFQDRLALAQALTASAGTATEIERLMNECQARYHFYAGGYHPMSDGDINFFSSLDATVCGYLDDEWTGTQTYRLETTVQGTGQNFEATPQFRLPPSAGSFSGHGPASGGASVIGRGLNLPPFDLSFVGYFNGNATITNLDLRMGTFTGVPIELQEKPCIPPAPLPGGSGR